MSLLPVISAILVLVLAAAFMIGWRRGRDSLWHLVDSLIAAVWFIGFVFGSLELVETQAARAGEARSAVVFVGKVTAAMFVVSCAYGLWRRRQMTKDPAESSR